MPVTVIDVIKAKNAGVFPIVEDIDMFGSLQTVSDTTARDAIPPGKRKEGMLVYAISPGTYYTLIGGITNGDWVEINLAAVTKKIDRTMDAITISVDPVAGTSPPAGTIIHSQAEYTALGYDLLYPQDALDILPIGISYPVTIELKDGIHLNKPDGSGISGISASIWTKPFISTADNFYDGTTPWYARSLIYFKGKNKTTLYSGSGAVASRGAITGITPTMEASFVGKLLIFTSGANIGMIMPIRANTDATINGPPISTSADTCAFDIYEPSAVVIDSEDGATQAFAGLYVPSISTMVVFENIRFGYDTVRYTFMLPACSSPTITRFSGCMFDFDYYYYCMNLTYGTQVYLEKSVINYLNCGPITAQWGVQLVISGCLLHGGPYSGSSYINVEDSYLSQWENMILVPEGYADSVFHLAGAHLVYGGECWIWSPSIDTPAPALFTAYTVDDFNSMGQMYGITQIGGYYCYLDTANIVVRITNSTNMQFASHYTFAFQGPNNNILWKIDYATARVTAFETNGGSNAGLVADIRLDSLDYSFDDFKFFGTLPQGTELIGQFGSKLLTAG